MATVSESDIRKELADLGQRRTQLDADDEQLMQDVKKVLRRAYGRISVTEAAELLHMHRTTVYRVYKPHG